MTLTTSSTEMDRDWFLDFIKETLTPLEDLRTNSDILLLPDVTEQGPKLNPNTIDICIKLIQKGIAAKMLIGDSFEVSNEEKGKKVLPALFTLNNKKEHTIIQTVGEWILKNTPEDHEVCISMIFEDESGSFIKNSITGTLEEIGDMIFKMGQ